MGRAALAAAVALPFLAYLVFIIFISFISLFFILCVESALPAFVSVRHMCAWLPWRPDEGGIPPEVELWMFVSSRGGAGN